tara:strand:+ start:9787 stop:10917 length:1131 start_codon:yes stop_codon:yes gene_type:complete
MLPVRALQPSGLNTTFTQEGMPFDQYLADVQSKIKRARIDLMPANEEEIVRANSPFEFKAENFDGQHGILLVHGLLDSPLFVRKLAKHFCQQGFLCRSVLLPGHGTVPGDLLHVDYKEWIKAVEYGIHSFKGEVEHLHYIGFSTGGALGIYSALTREPFESMMLIAPACKLTQKVSYANLFFGLKRWMTHEDKWVMKAESWDYAKYQAVPMNAAWQVQKLIERNNRLLDRHSIPIPMAMILTKDDESTVAESAYQLFEKHENAQNRMLYYTGDEMCSTDKRIDVRNSSFPAENILDFSHVCMTIPPNHKHYGIDGDYLEPLHENPKAEEFTVYSGALTKQNLKHYNLRRLTYNPDYEYTLSFLNQFIQSILKEDKT